jgi:Pregnancy-associated plasma protein-A/Secretion system C-terminal sorting domain
MKQLFLTLSLLAGFSVAAQAQQHKCGLDAAQKALILRNPNYAQELDALKQATRAIANTQPLENSGGLRTPQAVLTIPVVFHIIHSGEAIGTGKNISLARIQQQVAQLNADYSKTNSDISQIPAQFSGIAANCEIQFCLAAITPTGAATTGVTRDIYSNIPTLNYIESTIKPATTWNANRYLNVWVCAIPDDGSGGQTLGYAYLPSSNMVGSTIDGFVVDYQFVGTNAAVGSKGRTATHEIGHYLGLQHPWGSDEGDCPGSVGYEDDGIADTPPTSEPNYTPASGVCNFTPTFCNNTVFGSNYMDYANDGCMHAFSNGQKNVMRAVLLGTAGTLGLQSRAELVNNAATTCALTPVGGCTDPIATVYSMGFETTENTAGWVAENTNNDVDASNVSVTWGIASGTQPDNDYGPYAGNRYARYLYNSDGTTAANDWLFSPCLDLKTGRTYNLSFYTAVGKAQNVTYPEKLACYLTNAQSSNSVVSILNNAGTLTNAYSSASSYVQKTATFTVAANGSYYLGFKCYSDANQYVLLLDNINLTGNLTSTENSEFEAAVKVYPNPVTDILTLDLPEGTPLKNTTVQITDMLGRVLYTTPVTEYRTFINAANEWATGVYTLTLSLDGARTSKRFVVSRD